MANGNQPTVQELQVDARNKVLKKVINQREEQKFQQQQQQQQVQQIKQQGGQEVLQQILSIAQQTTPQTETVQGPINALIRLITKGTGPAQVPIGIDAATRIFQAQQSALKEQREAPKRQVETLDSLLDFFQKSGNREGVEAIKGILDTPQMKAARKLRRQVTPTEEAPFEVDPVTRQLTPASLERKARIEVRAKQEESLRVKREAEKIKITSNFNTTASLFKGLVAQLKGSIEEGGAGGLLQGFYGKLATTFKFPGFGRTAGISGQRTEAVLGLNRIVTGQNRVIKGVVEILKQTLPDEKDPEEFIGAKVEQSLRNSYGIIKAFEKAGLSSDVLKGMSQEALDGLNVRGMVDNMRLTPEEEKEIEAIVQDVLSVPATQPRGFGKPKAGQELQQEIDAINRELKELGG